MSERTVGIVFVFFFHRVYSLMEDICWLLLFTFTFHPSSHPSLPPFPLVLKIAAVNTCADQGKRVPRRSGIHFLSSDWSLHAVVVPNSKETMKKLMTLLFPYQIREISVVFLVNNVILVPSSKHLVSAALHECSVARLQFGPQQPSRGKPLPSSLMGLNSSRQTKKLKDEYK